MEIILMVVGLSVSFLKPLAALEGQSEELWQKIGTCKSSIQTPVALQPQYCPTLSLEMSDDGKCVCLEHGQLLSFCNVTSLDTLCPATLALLPNHVPDSGPSPSNEKFQVIVLVIIIRFVAVPVSFVVSGLYLYSRKLKIKPHVASNIQQVKEDIIWSERAPFALPPCAIAPLSFQYEMGTLEVATNNFSNDHRIGRDGLGVLYKGTLPDGKDITVKRLSRSCSPRDEEFKNEVLLLAKLEHRNLVLLLGFCLENKSKLIVSEFVSYKSLDYFLFGCRKQEQLNWSRRYNVIEGIARGMLYLHEDAPVRSIHGDLTATNVLLDAEMNPRIANFCLSGIYAFEQTCIDTSRVVRKYSGYMAPKYLLHGQSIKLDIYDFGMLVLEIISGKRADDLFYQSGGSLKLLRYVWNYWLSKAPLELIDPTLRDSYSKEEVIKCIQVGLLCVQEDITKRPTMATIVYMLNS